MYCRPGVIRYRSLAVLAGMALAGLAAGCIPAGTGDGGTADLAGQVGGFVQDFALQLLAAFLL